MPRHELLMRAIHATVCYVAAYYDGADVSVVVLRLAPADTMLMLMIIFASPLAISLLITAEWYANAAAISRHQYSLPTPYASAIFAPLILMPLMPLFIIAAAADDAAYYAMMLFR